MPLGFDPSLTLNNPADRQHREFMAQSLQQLGKQVSEGIRVLATNRDVKGMAAELKTVNPQSEQFPIQLLDMMERHPLAVSDKRGVLALSMLGSAHKQWMNQQTSLKRSQNQAPFIFRGPGGSGAAGINRQTGETEWMFENPFPEEQKPTKAPTVRNFSDGTTRQYTEGKGWEVISEKPEKPAKAPDVSMQLSRLHDARRGLESEFRKALKDAYDADDAANKIGSKEKMDQNSPGNPASQARQKANALAGVASSLKSKMDQLDRMIDSITSEQSAIEQRTEAVNPEALMPEQPSEPAPTQSQTIWREKDGVKWEYDAKTKKPTGRYVK